MEIAKRWRDRLQCDYATSTAVAVVGLDEKRMETVAAGVNKAVNEKREMI